MLIIITITILFVSALTLMLLRVFNPDFRYSWLITVAGVFLAWISIFFWQLKIPIFLTLPSWQPASLFANSPILLADKLSWAYAFSLGTLAIGVILTAVARENFPSHPAWAGTLALSAVGIIAVLAENSLTLVIAWSAIDLAELITLLASVRGEKLRERVVIAFSTRIIGSGFLLWAGIISITEGSSQNFLTAPQGAGIYMLIAAGLRLGILPMHMPFRTESALRRGYGTMLRLTAAASSLILLARIPQDSLQSPLIPYLLGLISLTALYSAWKWFQTKKTLDARPFWILGMASLAFAATLNGNPTGSVAWGVALVLGGGVLSLSSVQNKWLSRLLFLSLVAMSTMPLTLTATGWESKTLQWGGFSIILLPAHALLLAGYFRHIQAKDKSSFKSHNPFTSLAYPLGISFMLSSLLLLGFWGWEGASSIGVWLYSIIILLLFALIIWLHPRIRGYTPPQAHWLTATKIPQRKSFVYNTFWNFYYFLRNLSQQITKILENEGGILWALLFIILFASLLAEGIR
ncbi:MAG: hypothetical protein HN392_02030 [Anaerolineae bacterium]|jgi:hypothetical protein|nr:hypothetical protein [Anaerolineae bacterium]MBT7073527.1 hypothetical protein [Anaerolineae bacterium]MBT7783259.1 hypothetical protein [Anaerolineae bacterium]